MVSDDDYQKFVGSQILDINFTNPELHVSLEEALRKDACCDFIDIKTSRGTFQFAVYNEHNGCYGHTVKLVIDNEAIHETDV